MIIVLRFLTYTSIVLGFIFGILLKDLRIIGIGIILGVLFWVLNLNKKYRNNE